MSLFRTRYIPLVVNVVKSSPKTCHVYKRDFFQLNLLRSNRWIWYRWCNPDLESAWARLPCCLWKGPLKRDFLGINLTTFSELVISEIQKLWGSCFWSIGSKFQIDFKMAAKNWENFLYFSDNCMWIGNVILSLFGARYIPLVVNVVKSSPKICHVYKRDFFQVNLLRSDQWIWYRWCNPDLESAWVRLPCCLSKGPRKWDFLGINLTTSSEFIISEIQKLWWSWFLSKVSKFQIDFKMAAKNWQNDLCFSDNCIWIGNVILSLFRTGYFSSVANVFISSPKIWHVNNRDFFRLK